MIYIYRTRGSTILNTASIYILVLLMSYLMFYIYRTRGSTILNTASIYILVLTNDFI